MGHDDSFLEYVLDQLVDLERVDAKSMFGGYGLYLGSTFFGIVYEDRLFLKTDASTRSWYQAQGMEAFSPNEKQTLKNYFEVPADVIESRAVLVEKAAEAAAASPT